MMKLMKSKKIFQTLVWLVIFLGIIQLTLAAEQVVISKVLYDPLGTQSGGEAVEIYNPTNDDVNISGWIISTETSTTDATLPEFILESGQYFLIADEGWSTSRDNEDWVEADHEEILSLTNSDSGVALKEGSNIIDAVGWGKASEISEGLFEGTPHNGADKGSVLERKKLFENKQDNNNNSDDFLANSRPIFRNSQSAGNNQSLLVLEFTVVGRSELWGEINLSGENVIKKTVFPQAGDLSWVEVSVEYWGSENELGGSIWQQGNQVKEFSLNKENGSNYYGNFSLNYSNPAGEYNLVISSTEANKSFNFSYAELVAFNLSSTYLKLGNISAGENATQPVGLMNIGNTALNLELSSGSFNGNESSLPATIMSYTLGGYQGSLNSTSVIPLNLGSGEKANLEFILAVPEETIEGRYVGGVNLVTQAAE